MNSLKKCRKIFQMHMILKRSYILCYPTVPLHWGLSFLINVIQRNCQVCNKPFTIGWSINRQTYGDN